MATKIFPYAGMSDGLKDFDQSMTVQSELEGTKLSNILHKFKITGVLPSVEGRVALPADQFFGGEDFQSLQNKISDARANGLTEEMLNTQGVVNEDNGSAAPVEQGADGNPALAPEGKAGEGNGEG